MLAIFASFLLIFTVIQAAPSSERIEIPPSVVIPDGRIFPLVLIPKEVKDAHNHEKREIKKREIRDFLVGPIARQPEVREVKPIPIEF